MNTGETIERIGLVRRCLLSFLFLNHTFVDFHLRISIRSISSNSTSIIAQCCHFPVNPSKNHFQRFAQGPTRSNFFYLPSMSFLRACLFLTQPGRPVYWFKLTLGWVAKSNVIGGRSDDPGRDGHLSCCANWGSSEFNHCWRLQLGSQDIFLRNSGLWEQLTRGQTFTRKSNLIGDISWHYFFLFAHSRSIILKF